MARQIPNVPLQAGQFLIMKDIVQLYRVYSHANILVITVTECMHGVYCYSSTTLDSIIVITIITGNPMCIYNTVVRNSIMLKAMML